MSFQEIIETDFNKALSKHEKWLALLNKQKKICNCVPCGYWDMCDDEMDASQTECKLQNILKNQMEIILGFNINNLTYGLDDWGTCWGNICYSLDDMENKNEIKLKWIEYSKYLFWTPLRDVHYSY